MIHTLDWVKPSGITMQAAHGRAFSASSQRSYAVLTVRQCGPESAFMLTIRVQQMQQMAKALRGQKMIQPCADTKTWIEIRLVDDDGHPVKQARYRLRLPDESIMEGTLDDNGLARVDNILPGSCTVEFPEIDRGEWRPA